jgi:endonuclease/exonuclease/phosphatase family metal-dependent hydrolase
VNVEGTVDEYYDFTEITGPSISVVSSGNALPSPVSFDALTPSPLAGDPLVLERFEGMLVSVASGVASGPTDQFGETPIVAGGTPALREPGIAYPGLPGLPVWDGNPEVFNFEPFGPPAVTLQRGASVSIFGPLQYTFGNYVVNASTVTATNPVEPLAPVPVRPKQVGEFTFATQNCYRLDSSEGNYATRLAKFSLQIRTVLGAPDLLAVQEVMTIDELTDLAQQILSDDASLVYTPYLTEGNDIGGIDVGFLVRDTITVNTTYQIQADETFDFNGTTYTLHDRPPLALEGTYAGATKAATNLPFTAIAIHNRSLNDIDDPAEGPRVRAKRHQQATRIAEEIQSMQTLDPQRPLVVLGDFNAYEFTDGYVDVLGQIIGNPDPLGALIPATDVVNPDLTNQVLSLPQAQRYSYFYQGTAQVLDHILTSTAMDCYVVDVAYGRANADYPNSFASDPTTALRSSDHDGMVLFMALPEITVLPISGLMTSEDGGDDTFDVVLSKQPASDVIIQLVSSDATEGTVNPSSLTFTSANWNTPQTATVTGQDDDEVDGDVAFTIQVTVGPASDSCYAGLDPADVSVTNQDNDLAGIAVSPLSGLLTNETGSTDAFTVVLTAGPTAPVTVNLASSDLSEGTVAPAALVFTGANWDIPQQAIVTGVDDVLVDGNVAYTIITSVAGGSAPAFVGINPDDVSVTNQDDDSAGILVNPANGLVTSEAPTSDTYTVVLTAQPSADVTIPINVADPDEISASPLTLTFTNANWSTPQTVTVTGVADIAIDLDQPWQIAQGPSVSADVNFNGLSVSGISGINLNVDNPADYQILSEIGQPLHIVGVPNGLVGLYQWINGAWVFLENVQLNASGEGVAPVIAEPDALYGIGGIDGTIDPTFGLRTVPALDSWGLAFLMTLLMGLGLWILRR